MDWELQEGDRFEDGGVGVWIMIIGDRRSYLHDNISVAVVQSKAYDS